MKKLFVFILALLSWGSVSAQLNLTPQSIPSPNAASLGIYGAIPVGYYTGIPEICIPLYEIDLDGFKIPIALNYHASGLKVGQEASWVGMGWSLNAGGCITRSVQGWDDFATSPVGYFWDTTPPSFTENNDISQITSSEEYEKYREIQRNKVDSEPDIFYFNFGSYSGKFFVQRSSESGSNRPKATVQTPNCYLDMVYDLNKWIVTDGNGYKFYFGTKEISRVRSVNTDKNLCNNYNYYRLHKELATSHEPQTEVTSAWYLDSIVSPNRNKLVFAYAMEEVNTPMTMQEITFGLLKMVLSDPFISNPKKIAYASYSYSMNKQAVLNQIIGTNLTINFAGEPREDMEPRSATQKPTRLGRMSIRNNQTLIKEFKFNYFYTGTPGNYDNCRLFLSSVQELGRDGNVGGSYRLTYDSGQLPAKTSTDIDHWGYFTRPFTGMSSNCWGTDVVTDMEYSTLIPPVTIAFDNKNQMFYGHNRNSDTARMCYGILKSIQYPTGGVTDFTYEPCTTTGTTEIPPTVEQQTYEENFEDFYFSNLPMDNQDDFPEGWKEGTPFEITDATTGLFTLTIDYITGGDFTENSLNQDDRYSAMLKKYNTSTGRYEIVKNVDFPHLSEAVGVVSMNYDVELPAGTYRIDLYRSYTFYTLAYHEGSLEVFGSASCAVFAQSGSGNSTETVISGGPRIQAIRTADAAGNVTQKTYIYEDAVLMSPLIYHYPVRIARSEKERIPSSIHEIIHRTLADYLCGMSTSYVPMSTAALGGFVGYGKVTENLWNGTVCIGSTTYEFYNECDELIDISDRFIPGFPAKPILSNGLPKQIVQYDASKKTVRKEIYEYQFVPGISIKGVKVYQPPMDTENLYIKFYDLDSSWNKLAGKTIYEYAPNDGGLIWLQTENYIYEPSNYQIKEVNTSGSQSGTIYRKIMEYPTNRKDSAECYRKMVERQLLNPVVEERNYVVRNGNPVLLDTRRMKYGIFQDRILPESLWQNKESGGTELEQRECITHYDTNGKPNGYIKGGLEKVVYLWGYRSMYPVAKIEGATYTEVENWLGSTTIDNLANNVSTVENALTTIRNNLAGKEVAVTTYTYLPLVGMTSMTAPNGEKTTFLYDSQGRLAEVKDHNGKSVELYDYHYKE